MRKLRILLITQGVSRIVEPLISSKHELVGILESMPRGWDDLTNKSIPLSFLKKSYSLVKGRDVFLPGFCKKRSIPYNFLWKKNSHEISSWIASLAPDLIVIFSMSQLLKDDILKIPDLGVINLHPSFLPSYRGANPDFWQYYDMEMNPGATVHYVDTGEDTGDIIFQDRIHIPLGTKSPARLDKLIGELGVSLILKAVDAIAQGKAPKIPQPAQSPTPRARNLTPEEHAQIIDWDRWPIERIWHVLRGTESWLNAVPQPTGLFAGQRWSIQDYRKADITHGKPGNLGTHKNRKCIFTKDGVIYVQIDFDLKKSILRVLQN